MNFRDLSRIPLHKRYDKTESIEKIKNRYKSSLNAFNQIEALRRCDEFLQQCDGFYRRDYKDWMILMAIINIKVNLAFSDRLKCVKDPNVLKADMIEYWEKVDESVIGCEYFLGESFERAMSTFNMTVMVSWGFEYRIHRIRPETVEKFLRERMAYFDDDLPHNPLFRPNGTWPDLD
jgi:hypothetical protein